MKNFTMFSNYLFLLMAAAVLGLTACGDDPILNTEIPPTASITSDAQVDLGQPITLIISGNEGDAAMNLLTITEDGSNIDLSRINSNDIGANPASLLGANANSFSFSVVVDGPTIPGVYTYVANIRDANSKTGTASVDVEVIDNATPPTITYAGSPSLQVEPNANTIFNISATSGSSDLSSIAVYDDLDLIDPTQLKFNGVDFDTNPYFLVGDDLTGFDMADVLVKLADEGTYKLRFEVTDTNVEIASTEEITVEVVDPGTPITNQYTAVLLSNRSGPVTTLGGLDLDNGQNVAGNSADAEIVDLGIVSSTDPTWIRKIAGANGAELRAANASSPELFNFANINSREAIAAAYDSGITGALTNEVQVGDVFMVKRDNNYYIMSTVEVMETPNNNEDFYRFDIKTSIQ